jgi:dipeptidyl aminopeptidase/acylaminoacyl peptidase
LCIPPPAQGVSLQTVPLPTVPSTAAGETQLDSFQQLESDLPEIDPETLTIEYLRRQRTPGSDLVIEERLKPGSNYDRSIVSYLSEGLRLNAYMTVPQGTPPATGWPVIIFNHGYIPPEEYRSTERYIAYVDGFASNGYIVLRPDYRGHAFSEGEATGAYGSPGYTIDVLNALASVKRYPGADPNRIGMWGHSMGGYIALRAMVTDPDVKAGVIWAGVVGSYEDMLNNWRRTNSIPSSIPTRARRWRAALQEKMGTPEENPEYWNSISANSFLTDLTGPVQLHHGDADESVPVEFSRALEDQITEAGGMVEYYEYPGDNHNISGYFNQAMARSIAFFDEHVKNAQ